MLVLVTGGSGLVGKSIQSLVKNSELDKLDDYVFLSSLDCDLRNSSAVENIFEKYKPDVVIHLASLVAGLYGNMDNNYQFLIDNIKINTNILECCNIFNVKRLLNVLSTCVFPEQNEFNNLIYPLTSNQILNGRPHPSNSGYAHSKRILHIGSKLLTNTSDIEIVNLIPTNLYGKHDNYNLYKSHVIPGLIHKIYLAKQNNTNLIIKGTGSAKRQFVYVDDFASIILHFISSTLDKHFNAMVVSPPKEEELSIKDLVEHLVRIFEFKGKVIYDSDYPDGQDVKTADSGELLVYIPEFQFKTLDEGLHKTINHFIQHYDTVRK
jgi:GDP-L-fucose synthase